MIRILRKIIRALVKSLSLKILDRLLEIEDESGIWDHNIDDIHIWPIIRTGVLSKIMNEANNYSIKGNDELLNKINIHFVKNFFKTAVFMKQDNRNYDSFFISGSRYQFLNKDLKLYQNHMYKEYYRLFDKPLIFESSYHKPIGTREFEDLTYLFDYFKISSRLNIKKPSIYEKDSLKHFQSILNYYYPAKTNRTPYSFKYICKKFFVQKQVAKYISNISKKIEGDWAFINTASYLGDKGTVTKTLKNIGFKTVELQHGYVGLDHIAYNYPKNQQKKIISDYLPDYFLSYGKFWSERIRTPSKKIIVGNPALISHVEQYSKRKIESDNSIIVISQGTVTELMVNITKLLAKNFQNRKIVFKLHPAEISFIERYQQLFEYENVKVNKFDNIYDLIANSNIIIGYNSTSLYEAVAFGDKKIFVYDNQGVPDELGYKFKTFEELKEAINDKDCGYTKIPIDYLWELDWEKNVLEFFYGKK